MGLVTSLLVYLKPTNHKQECENCKKSLEKGQRIIAFEASGYQTSGAMRFCSNDCLNEQINTIWKNYRRRIE